MKAYLINLDRNIDRLESASGQLGAQGIDFERFPAVDGSALTNEDRKQVMARFHARMARHNPLTKGEIGCALSHAAIWRKMIEGRISAALILEDDVHLSDKFKRALDRVVESMDVTRPQVYLFFDGRLNQFSGLDDASEFIEQLKGRRLKRVWCSEAYVVTLPAARNMLRANYPVVTPIDWWGRWARRGLIEVYRVHPLTARQKQETYPSDVTPVKPSIGGGWRLLWWMMCRVPEKIIDELYWIVLKR